MTPKKTFNFTVPLPPITKERARKGRRGWFTPRKTKTGEAFVVLFTGQIQRQLDDMREAWTSGVGLRLRFYLDFYSDDSDPKTILEQLPHIKTPDCDNLTKLVMDALNKVLYKDDCQVFTLNVEKWQSANPRTEVTISYY